MDAGKNGSFWMWLVFAMTETSEKVESETIFKGTGNLDDDLRLRRTKAGLATPDGGLGACSVDELLPEEELMEMSMPYISASSIGHPLTLSLL